MNKEMKVVRTATPKEIIVDRYFFLFFGSNVSSKNCVIVENQAVTVKNKIAAKIIVDTSLFSDFSREIVGM